MKLRLEKASESYLVGVLLAIAGGYLDVYTYICRGGVFANAQTGNIVLLGINVADKNWDMILFYMYLFYYHILIQKSDLTPDFYSKVVY